MVTLIEKKTGKEVEVEPVDAKEYLATDDYVAKEPGETDKASKKKSSNKSAKAE